MKLYTVLEAPDGKTDRVAFIREGISWAALVFTVFWALWHRMWVVAAVLFAAWIGIMLAVSSGLITPVLAPFVELAFSLIFALEARRLQVMSLERAGFRRAGLIQASSLEAAELAYFGSRAPSAPPAAPTPEPTPCRGAPQDTLGLFGNV